MHNPTSSYDIPKEVDLVIMGAGCAGMATALVAALEGLRPLVIEKSAWVGGTAATSAGTIWIPGNRQSLQAGFNDSSQAAAHYMDSLIGQPDSRGLRQAYLSTAPDVVDYLRAKSTVHFAPSGKHPDYRDMAGAAISGRALAPETFDGRLLGPDFERVRPPIPEFMVLGGMMAGKADIPRLINRFRSFSNLTYSAGLFLRYLGDRLKYSRGTRLVMGNALVARLFHSLRQQKVPILFETTISDVVREHGRVQGVVLQTPQGPRTVMSSRGLVIATGGYGHNAVMRAEYMRRPTPSMSVACPSNTGEGLAMGLQLGGIVPQRPDGPGAFWTPVSVTRRRDGSRGVYPHLSLDRAKPGLIAVNSAGQRFVNEANSYHDFVEGMYTSHRKVPTIPAWLICEAKFVKKYGLGNIYPDTRDLGRFEQEGYVATAPTLEELARKIRLDPTQLTQTVQRYNTMARAGHDSDFGKGSSELNRFNGDTSQQPNPCLGPIEHGPFVALEVWPAEIGTSTGLSTNNDGQMLDAQGQPLPGLYVVGNDMDSIMEGTYPGPGTTLGPAITFGYRVAMHAAHHSQ